jgi:hypothetical protein
VQASLNAPSLPSLLTAFTADKRTPNDQNPAPAEASLIAAGTFDSGAKVRFEIAGQGFDTAFNGSAVWPENAALALNGTANVKADDFADVLSVAGLSLPRGAEGAAVHGAIDLTRDKGKWTIATRDLMLGTSTVASYLEIEAGADGRRHIVGKVGADRVTVTPLLAVLTDKPAIPSSNGDVAETDDAAVQAINSIWPSGVFNFGALTGTDANVRLSFASLDLSGNLATRDGEMQLSVTPDKVAVSSLSAAAAGGRLTGGLSLEKAPDGVVLSTNLKLDSAKLAALSPLAKGSATFELTAGARAQSPAGLIAVMEGTGHARLKNATVHGPSVAAVADIADGVLQGKVQNDPRAISTALLTSLTTSEVSLGDRDLPISLADGTAKVQTLGLDAPNGKLEATTSVDLTSLNVTTSCQISALATPLVAPSAQLPGWKPPPAKGPLPPVVVLYDGPLDNLAVIKSSVDVSDLQRELSVRQVERNVQQLELSRRIDEERVRREKEKRKALDAQRAAGAKKQPAPLPSVLPESAGTADSSSGSDARAPNARAPAAPAFKTQTVPNSPVITPQADQKDDAKSASSNAVSADSVRTPAITVEPIPPPEDESAEADAQTNVPVQVPDTTVRPVTATRPAQRAPIRRRTSSDEVLRSLGNIP